MSKEHQANFTESHIFWCPPLQGKTKPLCSIWQSFGQELNATEHQEFASLVRRPLADIELHRAQQFIAQWPQWQISRYNEHRPGEPQPQPYVLALIARHELADLQVLLQQAQQVAASKTIKHSVILAIDNYHDQAVLERQFSTVTLSEGIQTLLLRSPCHHASLLQGAGHVVVHSSWLGFEALLWQKPVTVLGRPFYAGLGLTEDLTASRITGPTVSLTQLVYLILLEYSYSLCPHTANEIPIEQALGWLSQQVAIRNRYPLQLYAIGFGYYWRPVVEQFLQGSKVTFVKNASQVPRGSMAVVWGNRPLPGLDPRCGLLRLEDGFLRSVGLGALFVKPLSWVVDGTGLYFDASKPSSLELLLQNHCFSQAETRGAALLREKLVTQQVSKYNTGISIWKRPQNAQQVILVAGQVETDASIACGAPGVRRNIELLQAVRAANPNAYIIYKPHPDVVAGARASGQNEHNANQLCDEVITDVNISVMLAQVDEVHVITSLAGFEALLRGKKVVCYGLPFYAGWGLTEDKLLCQRRSRKLTIEQLIAGALMLYPLYLCPRSGYYSNALQTTDVLANIARQQRKVRHPWWAKLLRGALNFVFGKR